MEIIPAIDIIDGKCVRLTQGDYEQKKIYNEKPLEVAKAFEDAGIRRLHLVDLDGAKQKKIVNHHILEQISIQTSLKIDFGGGIHSDEAIKSALEFGASQVTVGSIAVKDKPLVEKWLDMYGAEKIILGADAKDQKIAISGWQEITETSVFDFIQSYIANGIEYIVCTDISKDGLLAGVSLDLYRDLQKAFPKLKFIASGGVAGIGDLEKLQALRMEGVIIGKAIYEGKIKLEDLSRFL